MWARQRYLLYLLVIDLKNFEIISILNNADSDKDVGYFNKIYNGLGVQKYL